MILLEEALRQGSGLSGQKVPSLKPASIATCDKAACYACYCHYIFTVSTWIHGAGHVCIPTCVKTNVRQRFPGDSVFVGFNQE